MTQTEGPDTIHGATTWGAIRACHEHINRNRKADGLGPPQPILSVPDDVRCDGVIQGLGLELRPWRAIHNVGESPPFTQVWTDHGWEWLNDYVGGQDTSDVRVICSRDFGWSTFFAAVFPDWASGVADEAVPFDAESIVIEHSGTYNADRLSERGY